MDIQSKYTHIARLMKDNNNLNDNLDSNKRTIMSANITSEINNNNTILSNVLKQTDESNKISHTGNSQINTKREKVNKKRLFIENLSYEVHENLLKRFLTKYGQIKKVKIIRNLKNKSKGVGYVEFYDASDAEKLLANSNPAELILKERQISFYPYLEKQKTTHIKRKVLDNQMNQMDIDTPSVNEATHYGINDLPVDVLTNVLKHLCLRDLCVAEQVCKRWYNVSQIVWSTKKKLILNDENIFDKYVPKTKPIYGILAFPKFDYKALHQILKKSSGKSLNYVDLSPCSKVLNSIGLEYLTKQCENITHLNISKLDMSNLSFKKIKNLKHLKELNMAYCSQISDSSVSKVLQNCPYLETIDMTFCHSLTGSCLATDGKNLKSITIDQCENISDENLMRLFSENKQLTRMSIKRSKHLMSTTLLYIINNLRCLKELYLNDNGFDCLQIIEAENVSFERLDHLVKLELSNSRPTNAIIAQLLKTSKSLKSLSLSYCSSLNDNLFYGLSINSPLEELDLSFIHNIADVTLDSLTQLSSTLKTLRLKGNIRLTNNGIISLMTHLSNLTWLDVRNIININNSLLDAALKLDSRKIRIECNDTSINTIEFEYKYADTTKSLIKRNFFEFKCRNLTFEANASKLRSKENQANWSNATNSDLIYIGLPMSDSDDDSIYESYDFNDGYDYLDDPGQNELEELFEENQEMFDELNQY